MSTKDLIGKVRELKELQRISKSLQQRLQTFRMISKQKC